MDMTRIRQLAGTTVPEDKALYRELISEVVDQKIYVPKIASWARKR